MKNTSLILLLLLPFLNSYAAPKEEREAAQKFYTPIAELYADITLQMIGVYDNGSLFENHDEFKTYMVTEDNQSEEMAKLDSILLLSIEKLNNTAAFDTAIAYKQTVVEAFETYDSLLNDNYTYSRVVTFDDENIIKNLQLMDGILSTQTEMREIQKQFCKKYKTKNNNIPKTLQPILADGIEKYLYQVKSTRRMM